MAVDKLVLSGSTNGRPIRVGAKGSPGTTIHTGPSVDTSYDEIWLYANCSAESGIKLTIQWGGTTSPDDSFEQTIPSQSTGLYLIASGLILRGNATPLIVRAFQDPINSISIFGYVNRIS